MNSMFSKGYQRELTYKRKDGSYSAFGNSDKEEACGTFYSVRLQEIVFLRTFIYLCVVNDGYYCVCEGKLKHH